MLCVLGIMAAVEVVRKDDGEVTVYIDGNARVVYGRRPRRPRSPSPRSSRSRSPVARRGSSRSRSPHKCVHWNGPRASCYICERLGKDRCARCGLTTDAYYCKPCSKDVRDGRRCPQCKERVQMCGGCFCNQCLRDDERRCTLCNPCGDKECKECY